MCLTRYLIQVAQKFRVVKVAPYEMKAVLTVTLRADDVVLRLVPRKDI